MEYHVGVQEEPELRLFSSTAQDCEEGSKILMRNGFNVTLLNIIFGLLPITIQGSRVTYSRVSLATFYSVAAFVALTYVSVVFISMTLFVELRREDAPINPSSDVLALIIDRGAHVLGFLSLMLRGRLMASRIPQIWFLLSKSIQNSIVNIHGPGQVTSSHGHGHGHGHGHRYANIYRIGHFCRRCFLFYIFALTFNEGQIMVEKMAPLLVDFRVEFAAVVEHDWQIYLVAAGYIMWDLTTLSHVLVSMLLSYFVITLYACLKSVNDELGVILDLTPPDQTGGGQSDNNDPKSRNKPTKCKFWRRNNNKGSKMEGGAISTIEVPTSVPAVTGGYFTWRPKPFPKYYGDFKGCCRSNSDACDSNDGDVDVEMETRLNYVKDCYLAVEETLTALSAAWGVSILIEAQILVATVLANLFFIFSSVFYNLQGEHEMRNAAKERNDGNFGPYADLCIHFFFFYWLAVVSTKMQNESRKPLRILKDVPHDKFSPRIQAKIETFKSDITSTSIQLTAADYFVVNKNLMTAVCGSVITFLIVLVQFKNEEFSSEPCVCNSTFAT